MVARAGRVRAAAGLAALAPPAAQHAVWMSVLASCARGPGAGGGDEEEEESVLEVAEAAFRAAVAAEPPHSAAYVVMSHVYAAAGRWAAAREVVRARARGHGRRARVVRGCLVPRAVVGWVLVRVLVVVRAVRVAVKVRRERGRRKRKRRAGSGSLWRAGG